MHVKMKKYSVVIAVLVVLVAMVIGVHLFLSPAIAAELPAPIQVKLSSVQQARMANSVNLLGNVVAAEGVDISAKIAGMVKTIHFNSGQQVNQGALLISLNNADIRSSLQKSKAELCLPSRVTIVIARYCTRILLPAKFMINIMRNINPLLQQCIMNRLC